MAHGQARHRKCGDVHKIRRKDTVPVQAALLREVVVARAEARKIDGHKAVLRAERVARGKRAVARENLIHAGRSLVVDVMLISNVEIIVAIDASGDDAGRAHHGAAASHHAWSHIGLRSVFLKKELRRRADVLRGNRVIGKREARIGCAGGLARRGHIVRVVDGDAAVLKIAGDFLRCGNGLGHRVGLRMPVAFIVEKEESLVVNDRAAQRGAEIVLYKKLGRTHRPESVGVHRPIAQKIVRGAVKGVASRPRDDIDLTAAGSPHFRGVTAGLHLEFLHRVRRRTEVHGVKCRIGVGRPVQQEIVCVWPVAADAHRRPLAGPPIKRIHVAGLRAVAHMRAGNREHQIDEHAAI